jgi:hypothetical protein
MSKSRHFYCDNCGSLVALQDIVWLADEPGLCPVCGNADGDFVELVPKTQRDSSAARAPVEQEEERGRKHKIGEEVQIRSFEWLRQQKMDDSGGIFVDDSFIMFSPRMLRFAGERTKVKGFHEDGYELCVDNGRHVWGEWMLEENVGSASLSTGPNNLLDDQDDNPELSPEEAIAALLEGATLWDEDGFCCWRERNRFASGMTVGESGVTVTEFTGLHRKNTSSANDVLMTRKEAIMWSISKESEGWLVSHCDVGKWDRPRRYDYCNPMEGYMRGKELPDKPGSVDRTTVDGFYKRG